MARSWGCATTPALPPRVAQALEHEGNCNVTGTGVAEDHNHGHGPRSHSLYDTQLYNLVQLLVLTDQCVSYFVYGFCSTYEHTARVTDPMAHTLHVL